MVREVAKMGEINACPLPQTSEGARERVVEATRGGRDDVMAPGLQEGARRATERGRVGAERSARAPADIDRTHRTVKRHTAAKGGWAVTPACAEN